MNKPDKPERGICTVVGGGKLGSSSGGEGALCQSIERAIAAREVGGDYRVEVRVVSASRLTAEVVVNGKTLPEQRFAVMDRDLNPVSINHFADSLAVLIARALKE